MYKSKLQEYCQKKAWNLPEYSITREGFDHCPKFKATITVNGSKFSTFESFKSSKDAQNMVAKLAFDNLTGSSSALPVTPTSGAQTNETLQAVQVSGANSPIRDDKKFKEMAHLYKNQLQIYAQKRNVHLPTYSYEREGPPHASQFRSKVTFQEKTYECTEFFSTLKDAENAVAKIALMELSPDGIQEDDPGFFKNLLQELAQKEFPCLPEYNTTRSGASHMPMFISTVEINKESFTGQEAKTKKLAEMNAAKVAYTALKESQVKQKSEAFSQGSHVKDASHSLASRLQSILLEETSPGNSSEPNLSFNKGAHQKPSECKPTTTRNTVSLENCGETSQCSHNAVLESPSSILDQKTNNIEISWDASSTQKKVKVFPCMPNMTFPRGTSILHKDHNWVAVTPEIQSRAMNT